jgi:hypothetical protein
MAARNVSRHVHVCRLLFCLTCLSFLVSGPVCSAAEPGGSPDADVATKRPSVLEWIDPFLPLAMQKRPLLHFTAFTEMTAEGRTRRVPSPGAPVYYASHMAKFQQRGVAVPAGERPPPMAELEATVKTTLAANGFVVANPPAQRAEIMIMFQYGSHSSDYDSPMTAEELAEIVRKDQRAFRDVIERATLLGGERFARDLRESLKWGPPYFFWANNPSLAHLIEAVFHPCYYVIASAYDFEALEQRGEKRLLWRTKMSIEAQGVSTEEIFVPLIANAGPYFGREMTEPLMVKKRILRDGNVEIGTATVVEDVAPTRVPSGERVHPLGSSQTRD